MTIISPRSIATASLCALVCALTACQALDGKAERHLVTTEPTPGSLEIISRFLDINVTVATTNDVSIDASVYLETSGGNETAEREIENINVFVVHEGNKLVVRQGEPNAVWSFAGSWSARGQISIKVPANLAVTVSTASGDVKFGGDFGTVALDVSTASGDISLTGVGATSATIRTASGDGRLTFVRPLERFSWNAASGDMHMKGGAGQISAESASGDLEIEGAAGPVAVSTASGDVVITFVPNASLLMPSTRLKASTASGDVRFVLPSDMLPAGSITTASGSIRVPENFPKETARRSVRLTGTGATVECSTASGDVQLKR